MKPICSVFAAAALALAAPAFAAETPNSLSPADVSAGWILLFDGKTDFGWTSRGDAKWEVRDGAVAPVTGSGKGFLATTTEFPDYRLRADFWVDDVANSGVFLRCPTSGEISGSSGYEVNIYDKHDQWPTGSIHSIARVKGRPKTAGKWNTYDITAHGDHLVIVLNGKKTVDVHDAKFSRGVIALQYNGEGQVRFRNIKLQPLRLTSLFNGKDLTGWKEVPGHKSVYTVTPEGWLNVKNGNGDIQSEAQFQDLVMQLDIISNGDHLNSGVFFRALPGQFWSGYEAQIRNQWMGDDRSKPVDFGTGAIYNRQAARYVVPSDREWFTMTVVAAGPHIATWVNGLQVTDFTDTRPPSDNARNGYKSGPGVLSLQGHDPTTDLSFRNIKAAEMPRR